MTIFSFSVLLDTTFSRLVFFVTVTCPCSSTTKCYVNLFVYNNNNNNNNNTNSTLPTRRNGQININWKSKITAAAILNLEKNVNNFGLDKDISHRIMWENAPRRREAHVTKSRNRKLIRVMSSNECLKHMCVDLSDYNRYLNEIWYRTQIPHCEHAGMAKFT